MDEGAMSTDEQLPPYGSARSERVCTGFQGTIRPVAPALWYPLALLAGAVAIVLAALIYLALIGGLLWLLVQTRRSAALRGSPFELAIWVADLVLVVSLLHPLFQRTRATGAAIPLSRNREPVLFDFVDRLCDATGLPRRVEIRVSCLPNAGASQGGLLGQTRVLDIGFPLVEAMSLQQLAGIIAHEMGHFRWKGGARLGLAIGKIWSWLGSGVQIRQSAGRMMQVLRKRARTRPLAAIAGLGAVPVALAFLATALLVEALQWLVGVASLSLRRQRERHADRYMSGVAGSRSIAAMLGELAALNLGYHVLCDSLLGAWAGGGRLPEDVPRLLLTVRRRNSATIDRTVKERFAFEKRRLLSLYPADSERVASALRQKHEGIFHSDLPAAVLFREPEALARQVTLAFYRGWFGRHFRRENVVANDAFLPPETERSAAPAVAASETSAKREGRADGSVPQSTAAPAADAGQPLASPREREGSARRVQHAVEGSALERVFPTLSSLRPLPFTPLFSVAAEVAVRPALAAARSALAQGFPAYAQQIRRLPGVFQETVNLRLALMYLRGGVPIDPERFGLQRATVPDAQRDLQLALSRFNRIAAAAEVFELLEVRRVLLDLEILTGLPEAGVQMPEGARVSLLVQAGIPHRLAPHLLEIERSRRTLLVLHQQHLAMPGNSRIGRLLGPEADELHAQLRKLVAAISAIDATTHPELNGMTFAQLCVPYLPQPRAVLELTNTAALALNRLKTYYLDSLAKLADVAEHVEGALGLAPVAWPEPHARDQEKSAPGLGGSSVPSPQAHYGGGPAIA
jgi:Zn-dependent protease with chaperone function